MSEYQFSRFTLTGQFAADCDASSGARAGSIYHVDRHSTGGANLTPIARYFAYRPSYIEGYHDYWRIDLHIREHALSPDPMPLGKALVAALMNEGLCSEPIWLSVHRSQELEGMAFGEVFDLD